MIISASRRTDIPALYHRWFMNRIHAGFLLSRNPYNARQIKRVSLLAEDIDAVIFWTRNAGPIIKHLPELDALNYNYYFQYTLTAYPKILERHLPNPYTAVKTFIKLSDLIGKERVIWRYDPILLSTVTPVNEHKRLFSKIAQMLAGKTKKVVISFADIYQKTERNLNALNGLEYFDILAEKEALQELCLFMANTAAHYGMQISTCAEEISLEKYGVYKGKCIDEQVLNKLFDLQLSAAKDTNQRLQCGCIKSIDIGQYNTCSHGCVYCYAVDSAERVKSNQLKHDPDSPFLLGGIDDVDQKLLLKPIIQQSLF
ncbi:DUF1848 domain-containing protein [Psychromonas ossibalaenae]|uniref:DUF1848 domain-containing protein n=1 Tax=Psychromonas ossibalaenae TaxID=444922 RepID=UPI00036295CD|nr:DUF1848 domain-containing protein [Psychromonas ossibalaenae]